MITELTHLVCRSVLFQEGVLQKQQQQSSSSSNLQQLAHSHAVISACCRSLLLNIGINMSFSPIKRGWSALKQQQQKRKPAKRAKRKQKEAEQKAYAAQLKRADELRRIKSPKSSADFVLRHFYEADKVRVAPSHMPRCSTDSVESDSALSQQQSHMHHCCLDGCDSYNCL
jgi:hypothetical protein